MKVMCPYYLFSQLFRLKYDIKVQPNVYFKLYVECIAEFGVDFAIIGLSVCFDDNKN